MQIIFMLAITAAAARAIAKTDNAACVRSTGHQALAHNSSAAVVRSYIALREQSVRKNLLFGKYYWEKSA